MEGRDSFDQHYAALLFGDWIMHGVSGHHIKFSCLELDLLVFELQPQPAIYDEEHFVFVVMLMPCNLTFYFGHLDVLVVDPSYHARRPVFPPLLGHLES